MKRSHILQSPAVVVPNTFWLIILLLMCFQNKWDVFLSLVPNLILCFDCLNVDPEITEIIKGEERDDLLTLIYLSLLINPFHM